MAIASEIKEELSMNKANSGGEGKLSTILVNQPKANKECCNWSEYLYLCYPIIFHVIKSILINMNVTVLALSHLFQAWIYL